MSFVHRRLPDIRWGVQRGLNIATLFSLYAVITRLVAGPSAFDQYHMNVVTLVGIYIGGALLGGTLVGLMRPMTTNPFGAILVGFIVAAPIVAVIVKSWKAVLLGASVMTMS